MRFRERGLGVRGVEGKIQVRFHGFRETNASRDRQEGRVHGKGRLPPLAVPALLAW